MTKENYDLYDPDEDVTDAELDIRINQLSEQLNTQKYLGKEIFDPVEKDRAGFLLQCLMELRDRRTQDIDPPFMSAPGDWVLAACLVGIIWLIVKPYIGM